MAKQRELLPRSSFQIIDGPSKFDLMCSLFNGKTVRISCQDGNCQFHLFVQFQNVGLEDGSFDSWYGHFHTHPDKRYKSEMRGYYYNGKTRTGVVHEVKEEVAVVS